MPSPRSTPPWRCLLIAALGLAIGTGLQAAPALKLLAFPVPGLYDLAEDGSVFRWRIAYAGLIAEVKRAQGEETNAAGNQDYKVKSATIAP